jgi:hypothetical protein
MLGRQFTTWSAVAVSALIVFGIARAASSHYVERRNAFYQSQEAERKRLGLADWAQVKAKYPTPEITLCRAIHMAPGTTGEVTVRGKFSPGSGFLFENDDVEIVKESATATEYHATVRVPAGIGPTYSPLHVIAAVSGIEASPPCPAVYVGGKYEWDFTAQNGWLIKLSPRGDTFPKNGAEGVAYYTAQFYRANESKPFEVRDFNLGLGGPLYGSNYSGGFQQTEGGQGGQGDQASMEQLMKKAFDPSTSSEEREKLMQKVVEAQQAMMSKMSDQKAMMQQQQEQMKKDAEFGCKNMNFNANADPVEGQISCGQNVGTIWIKGVRRYVGPSN